MSERIKKINEVLREQLGRIILKEIDLPRTILVTVTKVETAKDLSQCKVFVSVIPERETREVLKILNKEAYNLHSCLNQVLFIRKVPKPTFLADEELKTAQRVDEILEKVKIEEGE